MDEIPIANTNPVELLKKDTNKTMPNKDGRIVRTLKNFIYMFPLAVITFFLGNLLGKSFGQFSTFPLTSFSSFIFISAIFLLFIFLQLMMRSIIYSTAFGLFFIWGVYTSWFGDFQTPLFENFQSIGVLIKSAWSRKNLPYPLMMSGILSFGITAIIVIQFFLSLLVKSFFEAFFGRDWGDGKLFGFLGAIALLLGVYGGFYFYSGNSSQLTERVIWKNYAKYEPIEQFITKTPGGSIISDKYVWSYNKSKISRVNIKTGKIDSSRNISAITLNTEWQPSDAPIVCNSNNISCYNSNLTKVVWETPYPASFPNLKLKPEKVTTSTFKPVTSSIIANGKKILISYDYGYKAIHNAVTGKQLWLSSIDAQIRVNRNFPEEAINNNIFIAHENMIVFSCYNAKIIAVDSSNGQIIWEYSYDTPKYNGKGQRGFLSINDKKLLVSFKSGGHVLLAAKDGIPINTTRNSLFSPAFLPVFKENQISLITNNGTFNNFNIDGGKIHFTFPLLKNQLKLIPIIDGLKHGLVGYRDTIYKIDAIKKASDIILKSKNHVFITKPVFDKKLAYIGTQEGWIYCVHIGSFHTKWKVHVNGELTKESLKIIKNGLIVKTKSGSLYKLNTNI